MRKIVFFVLLGITQVFAQQIQDSVSLGPAYGQQAWYDLSSGTKTFAPKTEWDLAFEVSGMGSGIRTNTPAGVKVWVYPATDTTGWATVDTTGISGWTELFNSDTSWSIGSFNASADSNNPFDLGWGIYSTVNHQVTGDSILVVKLQDNSYGKLLMRKLASGTYTFRFAKLDNSGDVVVAISKSAYPNRKFVYYSLQNNTVIDREPAITDWDLTFTQYSEFIPMAYTVMGVLHNEGVEAVAAYPVDDTTYSAWTAHAFSTEMNTIGYEWKSFTGGSWVIQDSLVFFVKDKDSDIWKLIFTGFGGSGTGTSYFVKEKLFTAPVSIREDLQTQLQMYPNPAQAELFVYLPVNNTTDASIQITDVTGRVHFLNQERISSDVIRIHTENIPTGMYWIHTEKGTGKFLKN